MYWQQKELYGQYKDWNYRDMLSMSHLQTHTTERMWNPEDEQFIVDQV